MKKLIISLAFIALTITAAPSLYAAAFPLKICFITGEELGDDPVSFAYKGRAISVCCKSCVKKFNSNPEKYIAILDKELAKRKK